MKEAYIIKTFLFLFFLVGHISFSAQNNRIVKATEINSAEIIQPKEKTLTVIENQVTKTYLVKNEEYYTRFIEALEGKKEYISSNPDLKLKAEGEGWFNKINSEIEKAKVERSKLVHHEK